MSGICRGRLGRRLRFSEKLNFADVVCKIGAEGKSDSDSAAETWHNVSAYILLRNCLGAKLPVASDQAGEIRFSFECVKDRKIRNFA